MSLARQAQKNTGQFCQKSKPLLLRLYVHIKLDESNYVEGGQGDYHWSDEPHSDASGLCSKDSMGKVNGGTSSEKAGPGAKGR